jgi:23S rRNA pseudouridine1911/1915/1917 synthase
MPLVESRCEVTPDQAGRIDQVVRQLTGRSRSDIRGLFHHACVQLNGAPACEPGTMVKAGDVVAVRYDPHRRYHEAQQQRTGGAFRVVYEDDHLIVVNKAAHLLTVPTRHREKNTLVEAVTRHVARRRRAGRAYVVHRLDRGTSGLLVFGKDTQIMAALKDQFRVRKADREYVAIVAGTLAQPTGRFESRLATTTGLHRRSVGPDEPGEDAVTHYVVERPLRGATLVRVRLETGRRNQIRVHFAEAGHPVLGDERYESELARHPAWKTRRLALHAILLGFDHPRTGERLRFGTSMPPEFERFIARQQ